MIHLLVTIFSKLSLWYVKNKKEQSKIEKNRITESALFDEMYSSACVHAHKWASVCMYVYVVCAKSISYCEVTERIENTDI